MNYTIFKLQDFNLDNLFYLDPIKNNINNGVFIPTMYILNNKKIYPLIQIPSIKLCDNYKNNILICPLVGLSDDKTITIRNFFNNIDNKIINDFKKFGKTWYPNIKNIIYKAVVSEIDEDNSITQYTDVNEVITFSLNEAKVYDTKKNLISKDEFETYLQRGNVIQSIIELKGINIIPENNNFEVQFIIKTHQVRVTEIYKEINIESYSFLESEVEPTNFQTSKNIKSFNMMKKIEEESISEDNNSSTTNNSNSDNESKKKIYTNQNLTKEKNILKNIINQEESESDSESINLNEHLRYDSSDSDSSINSNFENSSSENAEKIIKSRFFKKY